MRAVASTEPKSRWSPVRVSERARVAPQPKLAVGTPGDRFEREADRVAESVMRGGSADVGNAAPASVQRACAACSEEDNTIRGKPQGSSLDASANVSGAIGAARGAGAPLAGAARAFFEPRFGRSFGHVRVHADARADSLAGSLRARAFTVGSDIFFKEGEYAPASDGGRRLLAHELTHVVQQARAPEPMVMKQGDCPNGNCHDRYRKENEPKVDWDWLKKEDEAELIKKWLKMQPQPAAKRLNFYHGTAYSIAKKIPGHVQAKGGGDFAAGFYTHHDANDNKAFLRTLQWACRAAKDAKERYGGVIKFNVDASRYTALYAREFNLTNLDQADYAQRQADWIDFVTAHGREKDPVFNKKRGKWQLDRVDPPPKLDYDVVRGPMYKPIRGKADKKPPLSDFQPFDEARVIPQQVVFANKGLDLLNDADTKTTLTQHDCKNAGNVVDPPDETTAEAKAGKPSGAEVPLLEE